MPPYHRWRCPVPPLSREDKPLHQIDSLLATLSVEERKNVVTLCRAQHVPEYREATLLASQTFDSPTGVQLPLYGNNKLKDFASVAKPYIESPVWSGLILDMARSREIPNAEIQRIKDKLWMKEISTMDGSKRASTLNYNAIFYQEHSEESLLPNSQPNPQMNDYIRQVLTEWRDYMSTTIHYPRATSKRSSRDSERLMDQEVDWRRTYFPQEDMVFCQRVMERHYAETGIEIGGMCEMRQKWYRSGVVPRTYVAQGGDAYHSSKNFQGGFNKLVDMLPMTNYILRLLPTNLDLTGGLYAFIYDLSTFTSNFHEHDAFMRALAEFCDGYTMTIWDGRDGFKTISLRDALHRYADTNTNKPSYSRERWDGDLEAHYQEVAGFLGVFGNLMTCTFLHSVVILTIVASVRRMYTAGDDGGVALYHRMKMDWVEHRNKLRLLNDPYDDVVLVFSALEQLGIIAWQKVFTTQEEGCIALKRPLIQWGEQLFTSIMMIWPSMSLIELYRNWKRPDPRFTDYVAMHTRKECRSSCLSDITRFMSSLKTFAELVPEEDLEWIFAYLRGLYEVLGAPFEGSVPQLVRGLDTDFVATLMDVEDLLQCPFERTIRRHYSGRCWVPCREDDNAFEIGQPDLFIGNDFLSLSTPLLSYLRNMGYIRSEPLRLLCRGSHGLDRLITEYTKQLSPQVYHFYVDNLPVCLQ